MKLKFTECIVINGVILASKGKEYEVVDKVNDSYSFIADDGAVLYVKPNNPKHYCKIVE